jgi:polyhydroxyalkanoate synthesis regulator phasin
MARKGTESVTMYTTRDRQLREAFEVVHDHYGKDTYSQSGVLAELVKDKRREISEGRTRRHQIAGMREDITALTGRVAALESLVSDLVEEIKR